MVPQCVHGKVVMMQYISRNDIPISTPLMDNLVRKLQLPFTFYIVHITIVIIQLFAIMVDKAVARATS